MERRRYPGDGSRDRDLLLGAGSDDDDLFELVVRFELYEELRGAADVEGAGLIADERYVDGRFFPDLDRKAAVGSGRRTVCGAFDHDVRADDRFVGRGVDHASGNHVHVARLLDGGAAPPPRYLLIPSRIFRRRRISDL